MNTPHQPIQAHTQTPTVQRLSGTIERVTFHSETSGFSVLQVKVRSMRDLVTVIGSALAVTPGEYVECVGDWINNREYGVQFRATQLTVVLPETVEGMEKYLGSGLVRGVGAHFAKRLVEAFGRHVFEIIDQHPQRLLTVPGIGQYRLTKITDSWQQQKIVRDIVVFLQMHGVGTARAVRIYKTYGAQSVERVKENPYRLALDIRGIGFKTADLLAQRLGIPKHSLIRAQAGVRHVLQELCIFGHCAIDTLTLVTQSAALLDIPVDIIKAALIQENKQNRLVFEVVKGEPSVFLAHLYYAEVGIVKHLRRLMRSTRPWVELHQLEEVIAAVEQKTKLHLSPSQHSAMKVALQNRVVILTGGPGVGKTTLVRSILTALESHIGKIILSAPTGRAAKRLSESTGREARTLHRLLEFDPQEGAFRRNEHMPLEGAFLVVDEVSMVDVSMMHHLLRAIPDHCGLMIVGDVDQLPSIGPGAVLANLIGSRQIPTLKLTDIFRQAATSKIVVNAHRINQGRFPIQPDATGELTDFYFIPADTPDVIHERLMQVVTERIPKRFGFDPIQQIQVLAPMNRGSLGVHALNTELQKRLNPTPTHTITRYGTVFASGDKVLQTVNNYTKEVFNGDIGLITQIDVEESQLGVNFEGRVVLYEFDELDELVLAYATTIHKSQGSEYPAVVIPISTQHYTLLERNLLYTGITRGKSLVVLIGQKKALAMAIRNTKASKRVTHLTERLQAKL